MVALELPQQIVSLYTQCYLCWTHTHPGAEATLKRFWKSVEIEDRGDSLAITLDSRALKTPGGKPLLLPHSKLIAAALIVTEWENQRNVLKPHALPMVRC